MLLDARTPTTASAAELLMKKAGVSFWVLSCVLFEENKTKLFQATVY